MLSIKEDQRGDVTILRLSGKIVIGDGDVQLREAVRGLLEDGKRKILLDLGNVSYVDSAGLGALISSYTTTNREGGALKLLNLTRKLQDLLSITKLITIFETFDDEQEAIASFS